VVAHPARGAVHWADLDPVVGSEQAGRRPVVVVQNDRGNAFARTTIVVPVTSTFTSRPYPFQVWLVSGELPRRSVVKCDQVRTLDKSRLHDKPIAVLDADTMARVDEALRVSLGLQ
jgi:mRNA interferase MazF